MKVKPDPLKLIIQNPKEPGPVVIALSGITSLKPVCKIDSVDLFDHDKVTKNTQIKSPGELKDGEYEFTFVNPTSRLEFQFYPRVNVNGGDAISDLPIDIKFICEDVSTTITGPELLPTQIIFSLTSDDGYQPKR